VTEGSLLGAFNIRRIQTKEKQIVIPGQSTKSAFAIVAESGSANFSEPAFANSRTVTVYVQLGNENHQRIVERRADEFAAVLDR
jgi:hypothetical protein